MSLSLGQRQLTNNYATGHLFSGLVLLLFALNLTVREAHAGLAGRQRVATGLSSPMFTTFAPGDPSRLFILERGSGTASNATAAIKILDLTTGSVLGTPFLSIPGLNTNGEGGALGMAFDPNYATNGKFYLYVTAGTATGSSAFTSYLRQYTASSNPNVANSSFNVLLAWPQTPQTNHKGGFIGFSPKDGYLYMNLGDGGNGNDQGTGHTEPGGNAMDITSNLFGKTLRLDVSSGGDDYPSDPNKNYRIPDSNPFADVRNPDRTVMTPVTGDDEIWAYGLRNPFRAGFDRATGDYWIGDVGQDWREEVDFHPFTDPAGLEYGWRLREGKIATPTGSPVVGGTDPNAVEPIWDYKHPGKGDTAADANFTGITVIGGVPYRGPDPTLQGVYFFADENNGRIWTLRRLAGGGVDVQLVNSLIPTDTGSPTLPVSITEDAVGNLYVTYLSGSVYRIVTNQVPEPAVTLLAAMGVPGIGLLRRRMTKP